MAERAQTIAASQATETAGRSISWGKIVVYAILILGVLQAMLPLLWMVSTSLMTLSEVNFGRLLPERALFENYLLAWERANFGQFMWNSARITIISIVGQLGFCIP